MEGLGKIVGKLKHALPELHSNRGRGGGGAGGVGATGAVYAGTGSQLRVSDGIAGRAGFE